MVHSRYGIYASGVLTMIITHLSLLAALTVSSAAAQAAAPRAESLTPQTTLPIVFTHDISADHAHAGDPVYAKTTQVVKLQDGSVIQAGSQVVGRVVDAKPFAFDKTPYAKHQPSVLTIQFNEVVVGTEHLPLKIYVRAMADTFATTAAREPTANADLLDVVEQVGGDQLRPSQKEVTSKDEDVVAYNRRDGVYAHLISATGNTPVTCDSSSIEVSVDIFSASACGLYGFQGLTATDVGSPLRPSTLSLVSSRRSPKIWRHSTALLEVLPEQQSVATR
jgi:hypothetical protein